jgi:hypothetical protein
LSDTTEEQLDLNTLYGNGDYIKLGYSETYVWRVDCKNDVGVTTGDTWSFATIAFNPPVPTMRKISDGTVTTDPSGAYITGENMMGFTRRLVAASAGSIWYETINT